MYLCVHAFRNQFWLSVRESRKAMENAMIKRMECGICLSWMRIPVRFICFRCEATTGRPTCNSMFRCCLLCARTYLELNKVRSDRTSYKKCPLCPCKVDPRTLSAKNAYEKDFVLMDLDSRNNHRCIHEECSFTGSQLDLNRHISSECEYRLVNCCECKSAYFPFLQRDRHVSECTQYLSCPVCAERVPKRVYEYHVVQQHRYERCSDCGIFVPPMHNCPNKMIVCKFCHSRVAKTYNKEHLQKHVVTFQRKIMEISEVLSIVTKDLKEALEDLSQDEKVSDPLPYH